MDQAEMFMPKIQQQVSKIFTFNIAICKLHELLSVLEIVKLLPWHVFFVRDLNQFLLVTKPPQMHFKNNQNLTCHFVFGKQGQVYKH
jgi:hypothetical protein